MERHGTPRNATERHGGRSLQEAHNNTCREKTMKPTACWAALAGLMTCFTTAVQVAGAEGGYCIVVSKSTHDDPQWKPVVDALVAKHQGTVITFQKAVEDSLAGLQKGLPRYVCFVAKPSRGDTGIRHRSESAHAAHERCPVYGCRVGHSDRLRCGLRGADCPAQGAAGDPPRGRGDRGGIADVRRGPVVLRVEPGEDGPQGIGRKPKQQNARPTPPRPSSRPSTSTSRNSS